MWRKHVPRRATASAEVLKRELARLRKEARLLQAMMQSCCSSQTSVQLVGLEGALNLVHPVIRFTPPLPCRVWSGVAGVRGTEEGLGRETQLAEQGSRSMGNSP